MWPYESVLQYRMFGTCVMEINFEQCAVMKFCCRTGFTAAKMWRIFVKPFGDSSVSRATVF